MTVTLEQAVEILKSNRKRLEALGVRHAVIFGSLARRDSGPASDIDVAVTVERPMPASRFIPLCDAVSALLGGKADIVADASLPPAFAARLASEGVRAF